MITEDKIDDLLDYASEGDAEELQSELSNLEIEDKKVLIDTFVNDFYVCLTGGKENKEEISAKQKEVWDFLKDESDEVIAQWMCGEYIENAPELEY